MNEANTTALLEPDDLLRMPDGDTYELIDGVPQEKPMGARSEEIAGALLVLLLPYARANRLGRVYPSSTGYRCFPNNPKTVRKPDVSFVAEARLPGGQSPAGFFAIPPDLAVEVVSPNDLYEEVEEKVHEYLAVGVKLVWVVSPGFQTVLIRRPDGTAAVVGAADQLSGENVVPGFTCKVADLFV